MKSYLDFRTITSSSDMIQTLNHLPGAAGLYTRALGTTRRKPGKNIRVPQLQVRVSAVQVKPSRLAAYREICGFAESEELPITFPQVLAAPLHMWLMLRPEFPIPLIGLVHLRNRFEVLGALPADAAYDVSCSIVEGRRTHQGYEVDVATEFANHEGQTVYRSLMTVLHRIKSESSPQRPKPAATAASLSEYRSFDVPADIGRRYAPIGGDFNPIHLTALSAKALGFPRAIAHGMWSLATAAALIESARGRASRTLSVQFRQPLLLPGKVALRFRAGAQGAEFALLSRTSDKLHFTGVLD